MTTAVVVQARVGSSRLPGKVLLPLAGAPLLVRMIERLQAALEPFHLVVATTTDAEDDAIVTCCETLADQGLSGVTVFRGHPTDCLDRHLRAAEQVNADVIVKIPSDCPLIDPKVVDRVLRAWRDGEGRYDYLSNLHPPSWPDGQDVEVMSRSALEVAHQQAQRPLEREHTTPFFWENPERFRVGNVRWEQDLFPTHRWVVDYQADFRFVTAVFEHLYRPGQIFSVEDILGLLEEEPGLAEINREFHGVNWYRHHLDELRTVTASDTRVAPSELAKP